MPIDKSTGRLLVTRRAIVDIVRAATLGSYGVAGFSGPLVERFLGRLGLWSPGIRLTITDRELSLELRLVVSHGLPIAEVARQVDSAVRYALRRALDREVGGVAIHVDRLRFQTGGWPPTQAPDAADAVRPGDLAESGTDVA